MKKLLGTVGVVASLGIGAFALNTVMPASAGSLQVQAAQQTADSTGCGDRTTIKDVLDQLVQDGTITGDQEGKIVDALKAARESNLANRPDHGRFGIRVRAIEGAMQVAADKIGVSVDDLKTAIQSGQSVADVATAHGVPPADVAQAIVDAATKKIDEAVANGRLTERRADALKGHLPEMADRFVNHTGGNC